MLKLIGFLFNAHKIIIFLFFKYINFLSSSGRIFCFKKKKSSEKVDYY